MNIKTLSVGQLQANCYLVVSKGQVLIIDPGDAGTHIAETITTQNWKPVMIIATHGHFDHIMASFELQAAFDIPFYIHKEDEFLVSRMKETAKHFLHISVADPPPVISGYLDSDRSVELGDEVFDIIHTPGHTPGSVSIYHKSTDTLFSGDTIFAGGAVGRTDFSYASTTELISSVRSLLMLPAETRVLPGHGSETTVGDEQSIHGIVAHHDRI